MRRLLPICLVVGFACTGLALCSVKVTPPGRWTAQHVRQFAMAKVYEWDHGGQLIFVTMRPFDFGLDGKSSRWSFRCVSGDGQRVASFSVDMAHPAVLRVAKNAKRPPQCLDTLDNYDWTVDSPQAMQLARRDGLDAWLAKHPTFDFAYSGNRFELAANRQDGPYWLVSFAAKVAGTKRKYDRIELRISASTGKLLSR